MAKDRKILVHIRREVTSTVQNTWEQIEITGIPRKGIIHRIRWARVNSQASPRIAYCLAEATFALNDGVLPIPVVFDPPQVTPINRLLTSYPIQRPGPLDHVPGYNMYLPLTGEPPVSVAVPAPGVEGQGPAGEFLNFYETDTLHLVWQTNDVSFPTLEIQIDIEALGV